MRPDEPNENDLRARVASAVEPDESILWIGRPSPRAFRGEVSGEVGLGLLLALVALAIAVLFAVLVRRDGLRTGVLLLPVAAFGLHAMRLLGAPGRYRDRLGRCLYAVTDRRALTLSGFDFSTRRNLLESPEAESRSFGREAVAVRRLRRRHDGSSDFIFEVEWLGHGRRRHRIERGFFGVEDPEALDTLLDRIAPSKPPKVTLDEFL